MLRGVKKEMVARAQWRHSLTKLLPCTLYSNRARTTKRGAAERVNPETVRAATVAMRAQKRKFTCSQYQLFSQ